MQQVRDKILRGLLLALSFAVLLTAASACAMSSQEAIEAGSEATEAFMTNGDLQALDAAWRHLADVSALEGKDAAEREDIRVSALKAWLTLLAAIDAARDPEFDPDAPVDLGVEAPRQADGTALPGTPDPAQIKDPGQREAYQRALEQNRAQLGNSRFQTHVRRADERATSFAEEFITQYFAPQQSDQLLVSEIVEEAKLSADRRKRILSLLEISTR